MPGHIFLPAEVKESIARHIRGSVSAAVESYYFYEDKEDSLSGHLGSKIEIGRQVVDVVQSELAGTWQWSIEFAVFRGGGAGAAEKLLGADGIFEIRVEGGNRTDQKSLLFQAKKNGTADRDLIKQCAMLSTWREAAFIVNFTPDEFYGISLDEAFRLSRGRQQNLIGASLADFLVGEFLECKVGDTELRYDARAKRLLWLDSESVRVQTKFSIPRRIRLKVKPPRPKWDFFDGTTTIPNSSVHKHRMRANAFEKLGLRADATIKELQAARRSLSLAYHTDGRDWLDASALSNLNRRMQEINVAFDEVELRIDQRRR